MSRYIFTTRGVGRRAMFFSLASLLLAGCASGAVALSAVGQPSLSLTAPLSALACTSSGTCITLGASGAASGPTTTAQVRNHKGVWSALNVPSALAASFDAASCASSSCFFGGTQVSGDLLWTVNADNGATRALAGPTAGLLILNLSCASNTNCTTIDQVAHGLIRISSTTNAGRNWSPPRTLPWAFDTTTVLDCVSTHDCYVASTSAHHHVSLHRSLNGGVTWSTVTTPAAWTSLSSLNCATTCTALVTTAAGSTVARQSKLTWSSTPLKFAATSMSCASANVCLVVGHHSDQSAAMTEWRANGLSNVALSYVPTALTNVACEPGICVAVGVTTTVALRP